MNKKRKVTVYLEPDTWRNLKAYNFHAYESSYGANSSTVNSAINYFVSNSFPVQTGTMLFHSGDDLASYSVSAGGVEIISEDNKNDQE